VIIIQNFEQWNSIYVCNESKTYSKYLVYSIFLLQGFSNLGNTCFFNSMLQVRLNASLNAYIYYAFAQSINQTLGLHYIMAEKKRVYEIPGTELVRNIIINVFPTPVCVSIP